MRWGRSLPSALAKIILPSIAIGSHTYTEPKEDRYDGILDVNSAQEILPTILQANYRTYAPLCIGDWSNEEGARFAPAMIASGVWGGAFDLQFAHERVDNEGKTIKSALERIGFRVRQNPLNAHFECHIEQCISTSSRSLIFRTIIA